MRVNQVLRIYPAGRDNLVLGRGWQIIMGIVAGSIAGLLTLLLCSCQTDQHTKTSDAIFNASRSNTAQAKTLTSLKGTVDGLTPANLPTEKPKAQAYTGTAIQQNADTAAALKGAAVGAKKDAAVIASQSDPVKVRLNWIGIGLLIGGIAAVVAGIFFSGYLGKFAALAVSAGGAAVVTGILTLFVAAWLHTLLWICGGVLVVGVVGVGVWALLHFHVNLASVWASIKGVFVKSPTVG